MCDLRLPLVLRYVVITSGLLPSVVFLGFLTNVSGPYIRPIFRVQWSDWTLKMRRIYGPETLVTNQTKTTLGNNPEVITTYRNRNVFKLRCFRPCNEILHDGCIHSFTYNQINVIYGYVFWEDNTGCLSGKDVFNAVLRAIRKLM